MRRVSVVPAPFPKQNAPLMPRRLTRLIGISGALALALLSSGCSSRLGQFTGSLTDTMRSQRDASSPGALDDLARRYDSKPGEKRASIAYAEQLRANGQHAQAVAVLQKASVANVGDRDVAAAYGKALTDVGRAQEALQVLAQAHTADRPDWRILSSQGIASDQMGDHARAREFYMQAMQIAPNEASIPTNMALSYVLTRDLQKAEDLLRRAAAMPNAGPRVQANLALVLSLKGSAGQQAAANAPAAPKDKPKR